MENIVVVDDNDNLIGEEEKEKCHNGNGILHRGFLVMVFNRDGELFLTRRSEEKPLWPGYWDGTVASHVWRGEDYVHASRRRLVPSLMVVRGVLSSWDIIEKKSVFILSTSFRRSHMRLNASASSLISEGVDILSSQ